MKQAPVLTERDVKRVLQHCAQTAFPDRNRAVFQLGYLSGMRIGEIAALKISCVSACNFDPLRRGIGVQF